MLATAGLVCEPAVSCVLYLCCGMTTDSLLMVGLKFLIDLQHHRKRWGRGRSYSLLSDEVEARSFIEMPQQRGISLFSTRMTIYESPQWCGG